MPHECTNCGRTFADGSKEMLSGCPDCGGNKFQFRPDDGAGTDASGDGPAADPPSEPPEPPERPGDSVTRTVGNAAATVRDFVGGSVGTDATKADPPAETSADVGGPAESSTGRGSAGKVSADSGASADSSDDDTDFIVAECEPIPEREDAAQSDARSQIVQPDELPDAEGTVAASTGDGAESAADSADPEPATTAPEEQRAVADEAADRTVPDEGVPSDRTVADDPDTERADRPDLAELREELNDQFESIRVVEPGQYELNLMELYDREAYIIALQEDGRYSIQVPESWREADA